MSIAINVVIALVSGVVVAGLWQHFRYLKLRRDRIDDRQPLFYPSRSFHAVTYLKVAQGREVIDELRELRNTIEGDGGGFREFAGDCNGDEATVFPGATGICDGLDTDCDPTTSDGNDLDGDGGSECDEIGSAHV